MNFSTRLLNLARLHPTHLLSEDIFDVDVVTLAPRQRRMRVQLSGFLNNFLQVTLQPKPSEINTIEPYEPSHQPVHTHRLAAVQVHQINGTSLALEQRARLEQYLRHQALEIVLLLENAACQIQQYLIAPILLHGHLEQLRILDANPTERQISREHLLVASVELARRLAVVARFVGHLGDAQHVAVIVTDGHRENRLGVVVGLLVDVAAAEARVGVGVADVDRLFGVRHAAGDSDTERYADGLGATACECVGEH